MVDVVIVTAACVGRCGPCRLATLPAALRDALAADDRPCTSCGHAPRFHAAIGAWCAKCAAPCGRENKGDDEMETTTMDEQITELWAHEAELVLELQTIPEPIDRAPDIATALERIARREHVRKELEAVRAVKHELVALRQEAAARESELEHVQSVLAELEERLPVAVELDEKEGGMAPNPSRAQQVRVALARRREELQRLEAGGELGPGQRI